MTMPKRLGLLGALCAFIAVAVGACGSAGPAALTRSYGLCGPIPGPRRTGGLKVAQKGPQSAFRASSRALFQARGTSHGGRVRGGRSWGMSGARRRC